MGGTLKLTRLPGAKSNLVLVAGVILIIFALLPLLQLLGEAATAQSEVYAILLTRQPWSLLGRSLALSGSVTACTLAIGIPLGVCISRTNVPGRSALWILHAFPMFLPPFLLVLGWFHLLGRQGYFGTETTARCLFSELGVVAVLTLTFAPIVTSLVGLGIFGIDASFEEAALVVARPIQVVMKILVPAIRPNITLAAIIVFALALSELAVPMFLRVKVFPAAVFARLGGIQYAPQEAIALVLPLVPIALLLLNVERRFVGVRSFALANLRGISRRPLALGGWRSPVTAACWIYALLSLAPIGALICRAGSGHGFLALPQWLGHAPITSLLSAIIGATIISILGLVLGHAVARSLRGSAALDALALFAFVMPASVLGVGLIAVWNRAVTQVLYGSMAILVIGYVARYSVVSLRAVASSVRQTSPHFEEAAIVAGAGYARRLVHIVLPMHLRGAAFGWLLAMIFCLRDLETSVLFYPPGGEPLTVRIFTLEANGPEPVVAALAVLQVLITAVLMGIGALAIPRRRHV